MEQLFSFSGPQRIFEARTRRESEEKKIEEAKATLEKISTTFNLHDKTLLGYADNKELGLNQLFGHHPLEA